MFVMFGSLVRLRVFIGQMEAKEKLDDGVDMKSGMRLFAAAAAVGALVLAGCSAGADNSGSSGTDDGELTKLKVMTMGLTFDGALYGGIEQGFFAEEGLELELSVMANPPAGLAAAQSGQVDIAYAPTIPVLIAMNEGVQLQVVAPANGLPDDALTAENPETFEDSGLFVSPKVGIESLEDLRGKTIAVPARKAVMEIVTAMELEDAGVGQDEVEWVVLDLASAVSALEQGTIDAAGLVTPFTAQAREVGATKIASPTITFFEGGAMAYWLAGPDTIAAKEDAILAFQRAMVKTNAWANENAEAAIQLGIDNTDPSLAIEQLGLPVWPVDVNQADLDRANEKLARYGLLPEELDLTNFVFAG